MSKLSAFLKPVTNDETKEIVISKRFVDEDGQPAKVTIKTISQDENNKLLKLCTRTQRDKGQVYENFDKISYRARLIVTCTVTPDFSQKEICDAYGVVDPLQVPAKMFLPGEFIRLFEAITELNGFMDSDEVNEEAKNS